MYNHSVTPCSNVRGLLITTIPRNDTNKFRYKKDTTHTRLENG